MTVREAVAQAHAELPPEAPLCEVWSRAEKLRGRPISAKEFVLGLATRYTKEAK